MEKFETLTKNDAIAFYESYMIRKSKVLDDFKNLIEKQGGPKKEHLDFSPESLVTLWTWIHPRLQSSENHPSKEKSPIWYSIELINNQHSQGIFFSKEMSFYIDGLAYYFGDTLVHCLEGLYWSLCNDPKNFYYSKPIISGKAFTYPLGTIINVSLNAIDNSPRNHNKRLLEIFNLLKDDSKK